MSRKNPKKHKPKLEYRYYSLPKGCPFIALLGSSWIRTYGLDSDCLHFHNYLEIGYCYEGEGTLVLGEKEYAFCGGTFSVIPGNYPHNTISTPGTVSRWEYLFVNEDEVLSALVGADRSAKNIDPMKRRINASALFLSAEEYPLMARTILHILEVMRCSEEFYMEEAHGEMIALLSAIARENPATELQHVTKALTSNPLSEALSYINSYYMNTIKVEDLSAVCHMSETHFRRIFSKQMNMSPTDYLNLVRVRASCDYLKKTDESIVRIAEKCGFTALSTFNRNFRKITGLSPSEWRKRPENYEQQLFRFNIQSEEGW